RFRKLDPRFHKFCVLSIRVAAPGRQDHHLVANNARLIGHLGAAAATALRDFDLADVCFGSKAERLSMGKCCPLCPQTRTSRTCLDMSALCHWLTRALQCTTAMYDIHGCKEDPLLVFDWEGPTLH